MLYKETSLCLNKIPKRVRFSVRNCETMRLLPNNFYGNISKVNNLTGINFVASMGLDRIFLIFIVLPHD